MEIVRGIAKETLEFILGASRNTAPNEFVGLLREKDGIITDVLILPGTESSDRNAVIKLFMMPNVESAGSVHSHPGSNASPSKEDLRLFSKTGNCHIIVASPYDEKSWVCYSREGKIINLPVLDIELDEPELI